MAKLERDIQADIIKDLERLFFPDVILKNDSSYLQGIPDLLMVKNGFCYWLEVKKSANEPYQPNQEWYLEQLASEGSFTSVIYPEIKEEVYDEIRESLATGWNARIPFRQ